MFDTLPNYQDITPVDLQGLMDEMEATAPALDIQALEGWLEKQ